MNRKTFLLIVIITAFSLVGMIFIQVFWIKNALELQERIFHYRVRVALKGVVNGLIETKLDSAAAMPFCQKGCSMGDAMEPSKINTILLNSLVKTELAEMQIKIPYEYGIFNSVTKTFYAGHSPLYRQQLMVTHHKLSLSCLYKSEAYVLGAIEAKARLDWIVRHPMTEPIDIAFNTGDPAMGIPFLWPEPPLAEQGSLNGAFKSSLDRKGHGQLRLRIQFAVQKLRRRHLKRWFGLG